ncbi:Programmed cell death 6-interacting protein [Entamoeba marina]
MKVSTIPVLYQGHLFTAMPLYLQGLRPFLTQNGADATALQAIDHMTELRKTLEKQTTMSLSLLLEYDSYLTHLTRALSDATLPISFQWGIPEFVKKKGGLLKSDVIVMETVTMDSSVIAFERVHVLYNIGVLLFRSGASQASVTSTVSDSVQTLSRASGVFSLCDELAEKCGLSQQSKFARDFFAISKGYAQLAMYAKAVNADSSVVLRSKIAGGAVELLQNTPFEIKNYAEIIAHAAAGIVYEEDVAYGDAIAHYKECLKIMRDASNLDDNSNILMNMRELQNKYDSLCKDNDTVYFASIPDYPTKLESRVCVSEIAYTLSMEDTPFKSIIPPTLRAPLNKYQQSSGKIVGDTKSMIPQWTGEGDQVIYNINIRELENKIESINGFPNDLHVSLSRLRGVNDISTTKSKLEEINSKNKEIWTTIDKIKSDLKKEADVDDHYAKLYGYDWDRESSAIATRSFNQQLEELTYFVESTKKLYSTHKATLLKCETKINILFKGEEEVMKSLPKTHGEQLNDGLQTLRGYAERWDSLKVEREEAVNKIIGLQSEHQKTLVESIKRADDKNIFVDGLLAEFNPLISNIQKTLEEQAVLMENVNSLASEIERGINVIGGGKSSVCNEYKQIADHYIEISSQIVDTLIDMENYVDDLEKLDRNVSIYCSERSSSIESCEAQITARLKREEEERQRYEEEQRRLEEQRKAEEQKRAEERRMQEERMKKQQEEEQKRRAEEQIKQQQEQQQRQYYEQQRMNYQNPMYQSTNAPPYSPPYPPNQNQYQQPTHTSNYSSPYTSSTPASYHQPKTSYQQSSPYQQYSQYSPKTQTNIPSAAPPYGAYNQNAQPPPSNPGTRPPPSGTTTRPPPTATNAPPYGSFTQNTQPPYGTSATRPPPTGTTTRPPPYGGNTQSYNQNRSYQTAPPYGGSNTMRPPTGPPPGGYGVVPPPVAPPPYGTQMPPSYGATQPNNPPNPYSSSPYYQGAPPYGGNPF